MGASNATPSRRPGRARPTLARRALTLASRLGVSVRDIAPGTAMLTRGAKPPVLTALGDDAWILARPTSRVNAQPLGADGWLISGLAADGAPLASDSIGTSGWLVHRPDSALAAELTLGTQAMHHLLARHVGWLLRRYRIDVVLDVGANNGQFARELRSRGYAGHIVSFEPVPEFAAALERRAASDPRWHVRQMALGAQDGTAKIHVQRTFSSLLASSDYGKQRFGALREADETNVEPVEVPMHRLETILDQILAPILADGVEPPRIYLKMDTQGFDLEVFAGLGDRSDRILALQSEVALLLIYEDMPRMPEAIATYEAAGFEISGLYPVTREPDGRVIEYDCVMVRADAADPGR